MKNEAFAPTPELLAKMDAWWRAANYLSACQLYLLDDPLLRRRLTERDIKKKIVGHWGTVPGQNFIYTQDVYKRQSRDVADHDLPHPRRCHGRVRCDEDRALLHPRGRGRGHPL